MNLAVCADTGIFSHTQGRNATRAREHTQTLPLTLKINTGSGGWGDGALEISEITTCCVFRGLGKATWMLESEKDFGDVLFCWPLSNQWSSGFANSASFC
jgi:hypothetical protein